MVLLKYLWKHFTSSIWRLVRLLKIKTKQNKTLKETSVVFCCLMAAFFPLLATGKKIPGNDSKPQV